MSQVNRQNLAQQIRAVRGALSLTRVQLAKEATLAHGTLKLAEEGDPTVKEADLAQICRAIETLGFEFLDGTFSASLAYHEKGERAHAGVTADASMPGMVRRIYPRRLDARALAADLSACGVEIEGKDRLIDLCQTDARPWRDTFVHMAEHGRQFDVRFAWRDGANLAALRNVVRPYELNAAQLTTLQRNIHAGQPAPR